MRRLRLGDAGPEISALGYGTWQASGDWQTAEESAAVEAMRAALDRGVNWIDTAEIYGNGAAERLVAALLAERSERPLVFSKVAPKPHGSGLDPVGVRLAAEGSLARLGLERLDLFQVHWFEGEPDRETVAAAWSAMAQLVEDGLAARIGLSNVDRRIVEWCAEIHPVASVQNEFSILRREDAAELLPWLAARDVAYLAYSPLASGLLTGAITRETVFDPSDWRSGSSGEEHPLFTAGALARGLDAVDELRELAADLGCTVAELALRYVVFRAGVSGAILGTCNRRHVEAGIAAAATPLPVSVADQIEAVWSLGQR